MDRLSFFGGALSKGRKPPPKYPPYALFLFFSSHRLTIGNRPTEDSHEKPGRSLSRYLGSQSGKKGSTTSQQTSPITPAGAIGAARSETASPSPSADAREASNAMKPNADYKEIALPAVLRKRSIPSADTQTMVANASSNAVDLKAGQSILDQIGRPDHSGWMRKKGERYNSWKLRYFVLRGPHLYYLKSDSKAVRPSFLHHLQKDCINEGFGFRRRRSRDILIRLDIRFLRMRMRIRDDTGLGLCMIVRDRISLARMSRWSFGSG